MWRDVVIAGRLDDIVLLKAHSLRSNCVLIDPEEFYETYIKVNSGSGPYLAVVHGVVPRKYLGSRVNLWKAHQDHGDHDEYKDILIIGKDVVVNASVLVRKPSYVSDYAT